MGSLELRVIRLIAADNPSTREAMGPLDSM